MRRAVDVDLASGPIFFLEAVRSLSSIALFSLIDPHSPRTTPPTLNAPTPSDATIGMSDASPPPLIDLTIPPHPEMVPSYDFLDRVPDDTLTIPRLLSTRIPRVISDKASIASVKSCVSNRETQYTTDDIFKVEIPPLEWLKAAEKAVKERLERTSGLTRGGAAPPRTTVQHPRRDDLIFPAWIIPAWFLLYLMARSRDKWRMSNRWLAQYEGSDMEAHSKNLMEQTGWNQRLNRPAIYAEEFTRFASTQWLSANCFDAIIAVLNTRRKREWWVSDMELASSVRDLQRRISPAEFAHDESLIELTASLKQWRYKRIFVPAHINENHWILFDIDLEALTIAWGRSTTLLSLT